MKFKRLLHNTCLLLVWVFAPLHWANAQQSLTSPEQVPLFTLWDIHGNEVSLESYRDKVVLINFWATWCPPCVEEMPTMRDLKTHFTDQPFEILAVNMGEEAEAIETFMERTQFNLNFPLLLDPTSQVARDYNVVGLPASLVVDKQGKYAFGGVGPRNWNSTEVQQEILPLLEQ